MAHTPGPTQEMQIQSLGREDPLEKDMATHSSILAWKIPWTEEAGGLQSMGSQLDTHVVTHTHTPKVQQLISTAGKEKRVYSGEVRRSDLC